LALKQKREGKKKKENLFVTDCEFSSCEWQMHHMKKGETRVTLDVRLSLDRSGNGVSKSCPMPCPFTL
jgi:hypothetical protein